MYHENVSSNMETEKGLEKPNTRQELKKKMSFDKKVHSVLE